ncbi:Cyclin-like family protein [Raphanus sativus]|uniref:Plant-specific TFIIB-related protein 2 n=1 Tax=Raphanus sativus TaxID=3726 RepID=A0A9W3CP77_RAPSA|nr:plant-specific TFIIB-related protein 2 [Raphanus sativus]KAJ4871644.1 Cyclin-like family protein [Raphanus sativus]
MDTCLDCKRVTETVIDIRTGDTICTECSLVISDHYIDDSQEWRTFANDDNSDRDPNRVGDPTNPLLKSGGIGTIIDKSASNSKNDVLHVSRAHNLVRNSEEDMIVKACKEIKRMTDGLGLVSGVEFRACEIVTKLDGDYRKRLSRQKHFVAVCAASVSTACREMNLSRTLKEISTVANGVSLKEINRASMAIRRLLESAHQAERVSSSSSCAAPQVIIKTGELVRRFCSKLDISERETKAIREAVEIAENFDIRRNPKSVLAAIIFMICQLSQTKKRHIRDIAMAAEVVENTIKSSAKDMYPCASKIIPKWYASEEEVKRLGGIIGSWDASKH